MTKPLKTPDALIAAGLASKAARADIAAVGERYAIAITPEIVSLIDRSDPADPIARQFVPRAEELHVAPGEAADPIGDDAHSPVKGIVHRYPDRVLLKLASVCPVYCRFCFRREMVGQGDSATLDAEALGTALRYIASTPRIFEVIVTGGDPLALSPRRLAEVTAALDAVSHVAVIRWHTRVPVIAPERVTSDLVSALRPRRLSAFLAVHTNHPRELTERATAALSRLAAGGVALVSQTVLLKGVNDDAGTLEALFRDLLRAGVKPYYLHHADLAPGTSQFRTTIERGETIMRELRGRLSGLALPTYVLDIPGGYGKVPVTADYIGPRDATTGNRRVIDPQGRVHLYPDTAD